MERAALRSYRCQDIDSKDSRSWTERPDHGIRSSHGRKPGRWLRIPIGSPDQGRVRHGQRRRIRIPFVCNPSRPNETGSWDVDGSAGAEYLKQLVSIDRTAAELKVDQHVVGDRRRCRQCTDKLRLGVNAADKVGSVTPVLQCLNTTGRGTGANGDQVLRISTNRLDPLAVLGGRDRTFDQGDVVGARFHVTGRFQEMNDVDPIRDRQKFVFARQQLQLTTVTRGKLEYGQSLGAMWQQGC